MLRSMRENLAQSILSLLESEEGRMYVPTIRAKLFEGGTECPLEDFEEAVSDLWRKNRIKVNRIEGFGRYASVVPEGVQA